MIPDLENLIKGCKSNKLESQSSLYQLYKEPLFILSLKYCKNRQDAQDNLQDSFMAIFKNIKKFKGKGSFEGWMKRIVINKAIDRYKKEIVNQAFDAKYETAETVKIDEEIGLPLDQILECIQNLPSQYRLVFNLYVMDEYTHKEIASLLSISEGTSKSNLHRAKLILQEKINELKTKK